MCFVCLNCPADFFLLVFFAVEKDMARESVMPFLILSSLLSLDCFLLSFFLSRFTGFILFIFFTVERDMLTFFLVLVDEGIIFSFLISSKCFSFDEGGKSSLPSEWFASNEGEILLSSEFFYDCFPVDDGKISTS